MGKKSKGRSAPPQPAPRDSSVPQPQQPQQPQQQRQARQRSRQQKSVAVKGIIFCLCLSRFVFNFLHRKRGQQVITTPRLQPLVQQEPSYLSAEDINAIQVDLLSRFAHLASCSGEDEVKGKRKLMAQFNREGGQQMRQQDELKTLLPFFDKARLKEANAFTMSVSVVVACPTAPAAEADASLSDSFSVDLHLTEHPGMPHFVAHQVDVLYVTVPEAARGGELELLEYDEGRKAAKADTKAGTKAGTTYVTPRVNLVAHVRGDAFQREGVLSTVEEGGPASAEEPGGRWQKGGAAAKSTTGASSPSCNENDTRPSTPSSLGIKVVLEQYVIAEKHLHRTKDFHFSAF